METEIIGKTINNGRTEEQYRALECDSSSSIKIFAEDRLKYYKKFVKSEYTEEEDSFAIIIGKLVDCILLGTEQEMDDKFYKSTIVSPPTGLILQFVEALYTRTMESLNEEGKVTRTMEDLTLDAYNDVKFDKNGVMVGFKKQSYEKTVEIFSAGDAITYYREIRAVRPNGLTVITSSMVDIANRVVDKLKSSINTYNIFTPNADVEVHNQLKIDGFEIDNLPLKGMIDRTHIHHSDRVIQPYDLKCTWDVEDFYEQYYLKRKTYFQAYIYHQALLNGSIELGFDYSDYEILPPSFIVCDSANFYEPLIYKLSVEDLDDAYNGFNHKNRHYIGLKQTIEDLIWAKKEDMWNVSKENNENNGVVLLNSKKEN